MPGHTNQPGNRREHPSKNSLQAFREPGHVRPVVNAAHDGVEQRQQGDEGDQHGAYIEREMQAVTGAPSDGAQKIGFFFHGRHFHTAGGEGLLRFRD